MPRPQPAAANALRRSRPDDHPFTPPAEVAALPQPQQEPPAAVTEPSDLVKVTVRLEGDLHRRLKIAAVMDGESIQVLTNRAISAYLDGRP